ncbi:hypothetical protein GCM10029992_50120 [Glycomyces albus]
MAEQTKVIGGREPGRPRSDDEDAIAGRFGLDACGPSPCDGVVAEEAFDGVDADRLVDLSAVAGGLAGW